MRLNQAFRVVGVWASLLMVACGGGGGGGSEGAPPVTVVNPPPTTVVTACVQSLASGFVGNFEVIPAGDGGSSGGGSGDGGAGVGGGLGKVLGGKVTVTDLSDGAVIGTALTDTTQGLVTVKTCGRPGPFLVTMEGQAGARYYDEAIGQLVGFPVGTTLHALVDSWNEHVGVSPLTEAAYRYALNNYKANAADVKAGRVALAASGSVVGLTKAQVVAANKVVLDQVNSVATTNYQLSSLKALPTPIDAGSSSSALKNNVYGKSAALNGGLVKASGNYNTANSAPALSFAADFARDLTDGRIDGFALDGSAVAQSAGATYESRRLALGITLGTDGVVRSFSSNVLAPANPDFLEGTTKLKYFKEDTGSIATFDPLRLTDANIYKEKVILLSDGTVDVYRDLNGQKQVLRKFMTGVKQLFHRDPAFPSGTGIFQQQVYALKNDGSVWVWGSNVYCGEFYIPDPSTGSDAYAASLRYVMPGAGYSLTTPTRVQGLSNITSMAIQTFGETFLARNSAGEVFIWGRDFTQISQNGRREYQTSHWDPNQPAPRTCLPLPTKVAGLSNISRVFSSVNAHFALDFNGRVFSWGSGVETGQGIGEGQFFPRPAVIGSLERVKDVIIITGDAGPNIFTISSDLSWTTWGYQRGLIAQSPVSLGVATGTTIDIKEVASIGSRKGGVYLYNDGHAVLWQPNVDGVLENLAVPPIRYIRSTGDDVWLYTYDGRVFAYGADYPVPKDISSTLRTGLD